jgi:thiamine biosynthesis lipoprotein
MGTRWSALVYASMTTDIVALKATLVEAVARVDDQMSTWKPESDLVRLNEAAPGVWVPVPAELMFVLTKGLEIGRASDGAFDIGLGDLVNAWGFGPAGAKPNSMAIQTCLRENREPTHEVLELDVGGRRARKKGQVQLDLSGIAKGFAVDEMMRVVEAIGIENALVSLDGELKARGSLPDGTPWAVAVEKPDYHTRSPLGVITLWDAAIATSGDYRKWVDVGQSRLSHTMDRLRGGPAKNTVASVSVIAGSCVEADAWATALLVLGQNKGRILAERRNLDALFIVRSAHGLFQSPVGEVFQPSQSAFQQAPSAHLTGSGQ